MEFLKTTAVVAFTALTFTVQAQDKAKLDAFSQSYIQEAAGKYDAAASSLLKIYDATSYETNMRLGWLYYADAKSKDALAYYKKAMTLMPAATEPMWAIIAPLSILENWVEVEQNYLAILKLDAKNSVANYRLGLVYYYRKDYVKAKKYFDVSLNLYPFDYNNMLMSAWTNYFLGNKNAARILFSKTLLYSPNDASAQEGMGLTK